MCSVAKNPEPLYLPLTIVCYSSFGEISYIIYIYYLYDPQSREGGEKRPRSKNSEVFSYCHNKTIIIFNVNSEQEARLFLTPNPSPSHAPARTKERGFSPLWLPLSYAGTREKGGWGVRARTHVIYPRPRATTISLRAAH
jgi:hypothetical protein